MQIYLIFKQETCSWYFFLQNYAGHISQVRMQVTMTQINKKDQKCILALNSIQHVVLDWRKTAWFSYLPIKQRPLIITCEMWPVK